MNRNVFIEGEPLPAQQPAMHLNEAWTDEVIDANAFQSFRPVRGKFFNL